MVLVQEPWLTRDNICALRSRDYGNMHGKAPNFLASAYLPYEDENSLLKEVQTLVNRVREIKS